MRTAERERDKVERINRHLAIYSKHNGRNHLGTKTRNYSPLCKHSIQMAT